jgi:hypothetical protein
MDPAEPPWELADQFLLIVTDPRHSAARSRSAVAGSGAPAALPSRPCPGRCPRVSSSRPPVSIPPVGQSAMRRATAGRILVAWRAGQWRSEHAEPELARQATQHRLELGRVLAWLGGQAGRLQDPATLERVRRALDGTRALVDALQRDREREATEREDSGAR